MGLLVLYVAPFLLAVLYLPKPWDVIAALSWALGTLMLLVAAIAMID